MTRISSLEQLTIGSLHRALAAGEHTVEDLVQTYLERIEQLDRSGPGLNAIVAVSETALEEARELDARLARDGRITLPLHGVPIVVKDQIETEQLPTSFGNVVAKDYRPVKDATAIGMLRAAGAIILAKTTMPDFATSWFSTSSRSGVTKNPYDLERDPGGSSSGSAAAIAANLALVGIGEDTGGSIRLPASFCGLVGVRVTPGLISRAGMSSLVTPQDTAGPMTRTVADAARLLDVMVGFDPADDYTGVTAIAPSAHSFEESVREGSVRGRRIGVLRQVFPGDTDSEGRQVRAVVDAALERLAAEGAELVDIVIDDLDEQVGFTSLYTTRSQADMDAFVQARPELGVQSMAWLIESGNRHEKLDLLEAIVGGPLDPKDDPAYLDRVLAQTAFQRQVLGIVAEHRLDAIAFPDAKLPAPSHADVFGDRWTCLTYPTNTVIASQLLFPAVTIPAGLTEGRLPVGLEFMGLPHGEHALLAIAAGAEAVLDARVEPELFAS